MEVLDVQTVRPHPTSFLFYNDRKKEHKKERGMLNIKRDEELRTVLLNIKVEHGVTYGIIGAT